MQKLSVYGTIELVMIKAHKIRLNPTPDQRTYFKKASGDVRVVYNWLLDYATELYENGDKVNFLFLKKEFNQVKYRLYPWLGDVTKCVVETACTDIQRAFANFYRRLKENDRRFGKDFGFPKHKTRKRTVPSFYLSNDQFKLDGHRLRVPKLGWVNMAECLRFDGKILSATISYCAGHWYASIGVEMEVPESVAVGVPIGVDLGIKTLATISDGRVFDNQKHQTRQKKKLRRLHRWASRKQKGSKGQQKAYDKLAKLYHQIACRRSDYNHKMTTELATTSICIGVEDLAVANMLKNHCLAKAIADCGWAEIKRQLIYKGLWYGSLVAILKQAACLPGGRSTATSSAASRPGTYRD